jgi:hypothetical protein
MPSMAEGASDGTRHKLWCPNGMNLEEQAREPLGASGRNEITVVPRTDLPLIALAVLAAVVLIWVGQLPSSLWIDELGTFWVIDGDLASTADRAWRFHGQTPLYYTMLWSVTQLLGTSELVLRLPSLLSMLATAFLLYRFAARLFGQGAAIVALAIFVVYPNVGIYAADARPYALALLATLIATMLIESWLRTFERKQAVFYGLAAAAIVYVHYVFASILVAHALFFAWTMYRSVADQRRRLWTGCMLAAAVFLVTIAPTSPQVARLLDRSDELVFSDVVLPAMVAIWAPPVAVVALVGTVMFIAGRGGRLREVPSDPLILLGLGFVTPPLVLFMLGLVSDIDLWTSRYWFVAAPFGAMLFGVITAAGLRKSSSIKTVTLAVLLVGMLTMTSFKHSAEDWRSAMSAADAITDEDTPLLLFSNLIELGTPEFLIDPEKRSYVTSPLAYYPVAASVSPLPMTTYEDREDRLVPILASLPPGEPVAVVTNREAGTFSFISGWFSANGYGLAEFQTFGAVQVAKFVPR